MKNNYRRAYFFTLNKIIKLSINYFNSKIITYTIINDFIIIVLLDG